MTRRRVSNPFALAVLGCLSERPMHPYEISTTLRSRGKEHSIKLNYGSLYAVVESLQKHGLSFAPARRHGRGGVPSARSTRSPTPASPEFEDWLAELLSTPVRDFTSLEAGLSLMPGCHRTRSRACSTQRAERLRMELRTIDAAHDVAAESGLPELFLVESQYRRTCCKPSSTSSSPWPRTSGPAPCLERRRGGAYTSCATTASYPGDPRRPGPPSRRGGRALTLDPYS